MFKRDHHCSTWPLHNLLVWICNCVGYYNHRYFLLFLLYVILGSTIGVASSFSFAFFGADADEPENVCSFITTRI